MFKDELRTEACIKFNDFLREGAEKRGLGFIDVANSMISPDTKVIKPYPDMLIYLEISSWITITKSQMEMDNLENL